MRFARSLLLAAPLACLALGNAVAQSPFPPAPGQQGAPPMTAAPPMAPASPFGAPPMSQQGPMTKDGKPCQAEFNTLMSDRQKRGAALQEAQKRKLDRAEFCTMVKGFSGSEVKLIRFMEVNNTACSVPPEAVGQLRQVNAKTAQMVKVICNGGGGQAGGGPPPPPSLSDALGTSRVPDANSTRTGRGTLDTLTGNPLGTR